MEPCLEATLICSTGLYLTLGDSGLLVDALNAPFRCFKGVPTETAEMIERGVPPFDRVDGLVYSHLHPDHYHQGRNQSFLLHHPGLPCFFPTAETPDHGVLRAGAFTVEYQYLEHTPCDYTWTKHYVLLISAGGTTVYLTTDAGLDPGPHLAFLGGRRADYGFWNAMFLSRPETRALMKQAACKTYIYHMPEADTDTSGICRKATRNLERYPQELRDVTVLWQYPAQLSLPPLAENREEAQP